MISLKKKNPGINLREVSHFLEFPHRERVCPAISTWSFLVPGGKQKWLEAQHPWLWPVSAPETVGFRRTKAFLITGAELISVAFFFLTIKFR